MRFIARKVPLARALLTAGLLCVQAGCIGSFLREREGKAALDMARIKDGEEDDANALAGKSPGKEPDKAAPKDDLLRRYLAESAPEAKSPTPARPATKQERDQEDAIEAFKTSRARSAAAPEPADKLDP